MATNDDADVHEIVDPRDAAESAGLAYVNDDEPGITRHRAGNGFFYKDHLGRKVTDRATLERIRQLAIPPAYTDVWICRRSERATSRRRGATTRAASSTATTRRSARCARAPNTST